MSEEKNPNLHKYVTQGIFHNFFKIKIFIYRKPFWIFRVRVTLAYALH